jgi:hypothetical protein
MNKKKYYIYNNSLFQELRQEWEKYFKNFLNYLDSSNLVEDDFIYAQSYIEKKIKTILSQNKGDMKISIDGLIRNATLLEIKFKIEQNKNSNIEFDLNPIFFCKGKIMDEYLYSGIIE